MAQFKEMKRLAKLKAENEKSEASLKKMFNPTTVRAQAQKMAEYKQKKAKMLDEYNKCIHERVDQLPITKISYRVDSSQDASMRITRDHDPLNVMVYKKFRLKTLGFNEWLKVQALASKNSSKSNDLLLQSLRAKLNWVISQAKKLGVPPPPKLENFRVSYKNKKRKRSKILQEVFVKEYIVVDGMHRNVIPPLGVEGRIGMVIREPEARIFYYNGNFDLAFPRESEFHLATTPQRIRLYSILSRETLPNVRSTYVIISSEESHMVTSGSLSGTSQRPNDNGNRITAGGSTLVCENYGFNIHTIDRCFKIIGYPVDFGKRKAGSNFKGKNVSNNDVGSNSSNGFSDEQMATLISLIKENYVNGKGVHANMAVTHPNGTKVARISKLVIAFDEMHCYVMNQDLRERKILGTSKQIDGLYYFDGNQAKHTREPFPLSDHVSTELGKLVHLDIWGPYKVTSKDGFRYFLTIMDDFSKDVWVYLLKSKTEVFYNIMVFYNFIKTQFKRNIKVFRSDNGTEFVNQQFNDFCESNGIVHQTSCSYTPQQNEIVEGKHRHLLNVVRLPTSVLNGKSPYDLVYNMSPSLKHLRSFGCLAYATVLNSHDKFGSRSEKCVIVRYSNFKKGYKLWSLDNKQIYYSKDVKFFEDIFPFKHNISTVIDKSVQDVNYLNFFNTNTLDDLPEIPNDEERRNLSPIRYDASTSENESLTAYEEHNSSTEGVEPKTYLEASQHKHWVDAMNAKMDDLYRNNTWDIVDLPVGRKAIGSKWVWKIKYKSDGEIERYKARLVASGFNQREGIDFDETFSPVVKIVTGRCLINLDVQSGWSLFQMDINNAFMYGDLEETVYMTLPPGYFPANETKVCKLNKSLYGLKQALRQWNAKLTVALLENDFVKYCLELIDEFGLFAGKPSNLPMQPNISLTCEPSDTDPLLENVTEYQKLIGKLIYLTTTRL
ncbi:putative RNA-directed DNA polymerase, partial [Tanacetum coccineum]